MGAFDIDAKVKNGRLALIYRHKEAKPQIWFQDLSCQWFFIANSFTDYFRLMIMHLGIPNWHYAFTQVGLDPQTLQWFRFLSPERLAIDIENRRNQEALARKKNNRATTAPSTTGNRLINEKIKIEGLKRKKRRMRLKAKGTAEAAIEKFINQSSKSAKYAKTVVKKKDATDGTKSGIEMRREGPPSAGATHGGGINVTPLDNPLSAGGNIQSTIGGGGDNSRANTDAHSTGGGTGT